MIDLEIVRAWTADDMRQWVLQICRTGDSAPLDVPPQVASARVVQLIFDKLREEFRLQESLKAAAVLALREWRLPAHGYETLTNLSQTQALLKATAAIPVLAHIALREIERDSEWSDERIHGTSMAIAALCGFPPAADVEDAARRLFYHNRCPPRFAGQLFVGLCRCHPVQYPHHLPRFLEMRQRVPSRFVRLAPAIIAAISTHVLMQQFRQLDAARQEEFAEFITADPHSPLKREFTRRGFELILVDGSAEGEVIAAGSSRITRFSEHFRQVAPQPAGDDINKTLLAMALRQIAKQDVRPQ